MARSSATRRGNGAGWGGPAKGEGHQISETDARPIRDLRWDPANIERKAQIEAEMMGVLYGVAHDGTTEINRINAADKLLDRVVGKSIVKQDVTSKGERIGYVIPAPPEAEDAATWAEQHKPR